MRPPFFAVLSEIAESTIRASGRQVGIRDQASDGVPATAGKLAAERLRVILNPPLRARTYLKSARSSSIMGAANGRGPGVREYFIGRVTP